MKKTKKYLAALMLGVFLCCGDLVVTACAVSEEQAVVAADGVVVETGNVVAEGTCGAGLTWELTAEGVLTVRGSGRMDDYEYFGSAPWRVNNFQITTVVLEEGVVSIGYNAFMDCFDLQAVVLPSSLTEIGPHAFHGCSGLQKIDLPENLTTIGEGAFLLCGLSSIELPSSVTEIGSSAFWGCAFETIMIPSSLTRLDGYLFHGCDKLQTVYLSEGVTEIAEGAFQYCVGLKTITIPSSVTTIGGYAFAECSSLQKIDLPERLTVLGEGVFAWCSSLESITIPSGVEEIQTYAFYQCENLTQLQLPRNLRTVGDYAFAYVKAPKLTFPAALESVGRSVLYQSAVREIRFLGQAPKFHTKTFEWCTATAYYPWGGSTWTADVMQNYGGTISWAGASVCVHSYTATVTPPDCSAWGCTTYVCAKCGDSYKSDYTSPVDHIYDDVRDVICNVCGAERTLGDYRSGDINGDGAVNNKDATRLFQYLSDWNVEVVKAALDVNGDSFVNNKDATRLFQYLSNWNVEIF